jgi:cell division protein FtsW
MRGPATRSVSLPQGELVAEEPPGWDLRVLAPTLALVSIGVAMVYSAAIPIATREGSNVLVYLEKEAAFLLIGVAGLIVGARLSLARLHDRAFPLLIATLVLLFGLHKFGTMVNGARSWYSLPIPGMPLSFQPSEMAKMVLVVVLARYFAKFPNGITQWQRMLPPLAILGVVCGSIAKEPDMGTVAVIGMAMLIYFHLAGAKLRYLLLVVLMAVSVAGFKLHRDVTVNHDSYQWQRIVDWLHPTPKAEMEGNYQMTRSLIALGSGGLLGRGYCGGVEKFYYLPEPTTDYILSVIGEELGVAAVWLVLALFVYLVRRGLQIAAGAEDRFSGLVAGGVTCLFAVQALLNIAVISGTAPTTGITLPFVSYGGSSLLFSLVGIGLLLNVARGPREAKVIRRA